MRPTFRATTGPSLLLGVFICLILTGTAPAFAEQYIGKGDTRVTNLVELISEEKFAMETGYPLESRQKIALQIVVQAQRSGFDSGLLVALCRYEDEFYKSAARLEQFHMDTGLTQADSDLPRVWDDVDRMVRTLTWVATAYTDKKDIVSFYLLGRKYFPPDGYKGLNDEMKGTIDKVLTDSDRYKERIMRPGPQVIEVSPQATGNPVTGEPWPESPYTDEEVRDAYISVIRYYNPRLDEDTANKIFEAIAVQAFEYKDVDARFIMALVACESSFKPEAVSHAGAMGLGQLMPFTAEKHGVADPFDVAENIRATYEYVHREFDRWAGKENIYDYVLSAYNAGPGAVEKYDGIPPFDETINYVAKVTRVYKNFLQESEYKDLIYGKSRHYPAQPPR